MLAKKNRLSREEFNTYFKKGKRHHSPIATLVVSPHTEFHGSVVVSKKVSKKAPVRNTLRRRSYASLYTQLKQKNVTGVYILILKPQFNTLSRKLQHAELQKFIEQVV